MVQDLVYIGDYMRFNNYDIEAIAIASRYALRLRAVTHEQCDCTDSLFSPFVSFYDIQ